RFSIVVEKLVDAWLGLRSECGLRMKNQRGLVGYADLSTYRARELGKIKFRSRVSGGLLYPFLDASLQALGQRCDQIRCAGFRIPNLQRVHPGELVHALAVHAGATDGAVAALGVR